MIRLGQLHVEVGRIRARCAACAARAEMDPGVYTLWAAAHRMPRLAAAQLVLNGRTIGWWGRGR